MNATKHGAFARVAPLYVEDDEGYAAFLARLDAALSPRDDFDAVLVEKIALALWRSRRLYRYERSKVEGQINVQRILAGSSGLKSGKGLEERLIRHSIPVEDALDVVLRYGASLDREWMRCYVLLRERRNA